MHSKACETLFYLYPGSFVLLGSQDNTTTLAHPDEPYTHKHGRFEEAPVLRSRTWLEDTAVQNPLPHLYPARLYEASGQMLKQKTANGERKTRIGLQKARR